jgi:hypothetical protein
MSVGEALLSLAPRRPSGRVRCRRGMGGRRPARGTHPTAGPARRMHPATWPTSGTHPASRACSGASVRHLAMLGLAMLHLAMLRLSVLHPSATLDRLAALHPPAVLEPRRLPPASGRGPRRASPRRAVPRIGPPVAWLVPRARVPGGRDHPAAAVGELSIAVRPLPEAAIVNGLAVFPDEPRPGVGPSRSRLNPVPVVPAPIVTGPVPVPVDPGEAVPRRRGPIFGNRIGRQRLGIHGRTRHVGLRWRGVILRPRNAAQGERQSDSGDGQPGCSLQSWNGSRDVRRWICVHWFITCCLVIRRDVIGNVSARSLPQASPHCAATVV